MSTGSRGDEILISSDEQRAYDSIVRPNAIVPVPRYFLSHWVPLLGASRAWLALAFRQVAFVTRSGNHEVSVHTTLRRLGRWCGLTHVRVHQLLKEPEQLTWFVRNPHGELSYRQGPRSLSSTYWVRSEIPLTPEDQHRLEIWLEKQSPTDDTSWIDILEGAIAARDTDLPTRSKLPKNPHTIQQIVASMRSVDSPLPPSLDRACTELHAQWVQPDRVTLVTHYFVKKWLPDLSSGLGWLVVYLRSRLYHQSQVTPVGRVWISGGWGEIAAALNVSRKSVTRWSTTSESHLFFDRIDDIFDPIDSRSILIAIRLSEPIHPQDQFSYQTLVKGQNLTTIRSSAGQNLTRSHSPPGQDLTSPPDIDPSWGQNLTSKGQDSTTLGQDLTTPETKFTKPGTKFNTLSILKNNSEYDQYNKKQPPLQLESIASSVVVATNQWPITKILNTAGIGKHISTAILSASSEEQEHFIGWLFFALTIPRIEYPVLFASKRLRDGPPPEDCRKLSSIPVDQLIDWLTGQDDNMPRLLENCIRQLQKGNAIRELMTIGALPAEDQASLTSHTENGDNDVGTAPPIANEDQHAWHTALSQLRMELPKATFETWVRDIELVKAQEDTFIIAVANTYARDWLDDRLKSTTERVMTGITGRPSKIKFVVQYEVG